MNDSMKILEAQKQVPKPHGELTRSSLKADMPQWDTPKYLQGNEFPLNDMEPDDHPPKKQKTNPKNQKKSSGSAKNEPWNKRKVYSEVEGPGYIRRSPVRSWFNTFMIMNIPIIGWIYLFILALSKKDQRKDFAKAYLVYKLIFLLLALAIIAYGLYVGMEAADTFLQYINML